METQNPIIDNEAEIYAFNLTEKWLRKVKRANIKILRCFVKVYKWLKHLKEMEQQLIIDDLMTNGDFVYTPAGIMKG